MPVRVDLTQNSRSVASQIVTGSHAYYFRVRPGPYVVSSDQQYVAPVPVTLRSGHTGHVDLRADCK
jgi:hypothetical protein